MVMKQNFFIFDGSKVMVDILTNLLKFPTIKINNRLHIHYTYKDHFVRALIG